MWSNILITQWFELLFYKNKYIKVLNVRYILFEFNVEKTFYCEACTEYLLLSGLTANTAFSVYVDVL